MPASWLAALNGPDLQPVMSPQRMKRLGFIYDSHSTSANPYHWPVGFAVDSSSSIPTVGLTCAACHTEQMTYRGTSIRVDGGQANIDADAFARVVATALLTTGASLVRREAFERRAVAFGYPRNRIDADFRAEYGQLLAQIPEQLRVAAVTTRAGPGRLDALAAIARAVFSYDIDVPSNTNKPTGPVDYPYLWNTWNLYWVEYNGAVRQPMGRNVGEALGVGAVTHFVDPTTGKPTPLSGRWKTSVRVANIYGIETMLASLRPPPWPQSIFGPIDETRAARGRQLFIQNCAACHAVRAIASSPNEWSVRVVPLAVVGTDPMQANNFAYTTYDATKLGLSAHTTAARGLQIVTTAVQQQAYLDAGIPQAAWPTYNGFGRPGIVTAPCGYKARPLVGVWATPPYLHNGSVPTIFDLLSETRPSRFRVGGTEYDPRRMGFVQATGPGTMLFDTSVVGNSNAGHWFTNDRRPGRIGRRLSDTEKYDIIEYLKVASYADYPRVTVTEPDPEPCVASSNYR